MRLKFPDMTHIHAQFDNPLKLQLRAKDISQIAGKVIRKFEQPKLFGRLKERILEVWRS